MRDIRQPNAAKGRQRSLHVKRVKLLAERMFLKLDWCDIHDLERPCSACQDEANDVRRDE